MPIYEFKCEECGREFEVFQRITDPEVTTCKFCKGHTRKLVSLSTFHLKGTGWYVTDYGGKRVPPASDGSNKEETSAESSESKASSPTLGTDEA